MVNQYKIQMAQEIEDMIRNAKVLGIVDINKLPSSQYQELRKKIGKKANIRVVKKRVLLKVLEKLNFPEKLKEYVNKAVIVGLLTTNENPFRLYKFAEKNKTTTFAKAGDIAPQDIVVPAGDTGIPPGPIISEFKSAGIKARIQGNSIHIQEDSVIAKEGEIIDDIKANILMKLNIKPIFVGLNILSMYEDGIVYDSNILNIDEEMYYNNIVNASRQAFNLAYNIDYYTPEVIELKLIEASQKALSLAYNTNIYSKDTIEMIIQKAYSQAISLALMFSEDKKKELGIDIAIPTAGQKQQEPSQAGSAEESKKEEKKEEDKSEEEAAAGLGALFG